MFTAGRYSDIGRKVDDGLELSLRAIVCWRRRCVGRGGFAGGDDDDEGRWIPLSLSG